MKIFSSLASLDQIRGSPLGPMLREIVIRMLGHFEYNPEDDGYVVLIEEGDIDRDMVDQEQYLEAHIMHCSDYGGTVITETTSTISEPTWAGLRGLRQDCRISRQKPRDSPRKL